MTTEVATVRQSATDVNRVKRAVRERDGHRCTRCGNPSLDGRKLDVHRTTPGSPYTVDGCVSVCRGCHSDLPKSPHGKGRRSTPGTTLISVEMRSDIVVAIKEYAWARGESLRAALERAVVREMNSPPPPPEYQPFPRMVGNE